MTSNLDAKGSVRLAVDAPISTSSIEKVEKAYLCVTGWYHQVRRGTKPSHMRIDGQQARRTTNANEHS